MLTTVFLTATVTITGSRVFPVTVIDFYSSNVNYTSGLFDVRFKLVLPLLIIPDRPTLFYRQAKLIVPSEIHDFKMVKIVFSLGGRNPDIRILKKKDYRDCKDSQLRMCGPTSFATLTLRSFDPWPF